MAFSATAWVGCPLSHAGYTRNYGNDELCDAFVLCFQRSRRGALCVARDVKVKAQAEAVVSTRTIFQVNDTIRRSNSVQDALKLLEDSKASGFVPNEGTYASLMLLCKRQRQGDRALIVYEAMKQAKEPISLRTYNLLLGCCQQSSRLEDAMRVKREMEAAGVIPDVVTYTTLMDTVVKASPYRDRTSASERLKKALDLFKEMEGHSIVPDIKAFNTLIAAAADAKASNQAQELYQSALTAGLTPTDYTFELLLKCLGTGGKFGVALQVYNEARAAGVKLPVRAYNLLIDACATAPKPNKEKAWSFYEQIEAGKDLKATPETFISLIDVSSRVKDNAGVMKAFEEMKKRGFTKSLKTLVYNQIIDAASRTCSLDDAIKIFEEMKTSGNKPTAQTYECLVSACIRNKEFERAETLKADFAGINVSTNLNVLNSLMRAYGEAGKWDEAVQIFRGMKGVTPNSASYSILFDACCNLSGINYSETTKIEATPGMEAAIALYGEHKEKLNNYDSKSLERIDLRNLNLSGILVALFSWLREVKETPPSTDLIIVTGNSVPGSLNTASTNGDEKENTSKKQPRLPKRHYFAQRVVRSFGLPVKRLNTLAMLTLTVPNEPVKKWASETEADGATTTAAVQVEETAATTPIEEVVEATTTTAAVQVEETATTTPIEEAEKIPAEEGTKVAPKAEEAKPEDGALQVEEVVSAESS